MTMPAPQYLTPGQYPKMLYRSDAMFADDEALKQGLTPGGGIRTCTVDDEGAEATAVEAGWTETPSDFIGAADAPKRGRKAKAEEAAA